MYRLTIEQASNTVPYIVADAQSLQEVQDYLKDYKERLTDPELFVNYDIIEVHNILKSSNTLEDIALTELGQPSINTNYKDYIQALEDIQETISVHYSNHKFSIADDLYNQIVDIIDNVKGVS